MAEDLAAFGAVAPESDLDEDADEVSADDRFPVYPENWQTVEVFRRCADSWDIVSGQGGAHYQALKTERIESVLRLMQIPDSNKLEIFDNLRVMQAAAKEVLNERE